MTPPRQSVIRFVEQASRVRVLVAGDAMLDAYISGAATRISPEAPVPVVEVAHRRYVAGGAANVAANVRAMGARALLAGIAGADSAASILRKELEKAGIQPAGLVEDPSRCTTTKTRITASGQQIVRFDDESVAAPSPSIDAALRSACAALLAEVDAVVLSDYAKGVLTGPFCGWLIEAARNLGKPVIVDPKSRDFTRYRGATVITPNLKEAATASGDPIHDQAQLSRAAADLLPVIAPSALLVTQGGDGMSLFCPDGEMIRIPAIPVEVADVTGAGDTVVAVLAIALGARIPLAEAATLANLAAGIAVRHTGTWAVHKEDLLQDSERIP